MSLRVTVRERYRDENNQFLFLNDGNALMVDKDELYYWDGKNANLLAENVEYCWTQNGKEASFEYIMMR